MTREKAKYILREIKSIKRYSMIIAGFDVDLKRIHDEIETLQMPTCPNANTGPAIQNHKDKYTLVNSLLSDEIDYMNEREEFMNLKVKAEHYYVKLKLVCESLDLISFADDFIGGVKENELKTKYGYANPYKKMIDLIRKSEEKRHV